MKNVFYFFFGICLIGIGCSKDDAKALFFDYHAHIHLPTTVQKILGDSLKIEIDFESHKAQTVHHINVRIYNKLTPNLDIYNKPTNPHVDTPMEYTYEDMILLNALNGFAANADYVLEAKVWGENDGQEEVIEKVEFHIAP